MNITSEQIYDMGVNVLGFPNVPALWGHDIHYRVMNHLGMDATNIDDVQRYLEALPVDNITQAEIEQHFLGVDGRGRQ